MVEVDIERAREGIQKQLEERGIKQIGRTTQEWIEPDEEPDARGRGILTKADREFLYGDKEYSYPQSESNKKEDIRQRVADSIKDFQILFWLWPEEQQETTFANLGEEDFETHLAHIIAFLYQGLALDEKQLASCIERGIELGEFWSGTDNGRLNSEISEIDVSIDIEYDPDTEYLREKYERGEFLRDHEIGLLVKTGELSMREIQELQVEKEDES